MGGSCSKNGRRKRNAYKTLVLKPGGKRPLGRLKCGWIILKWILEGQDGVVWSGLIRLWIGCSVGLL
jgi:hypothetical protein